MSNQAKEQPGEDNYLLGPDNTVLSTPEQNQAAVNAAAVHPETTGQPDIKIETLRQMGIAAADRATRQAAGLPPRVHDLR